MERSSRFRFFHRNALIASIATLVGACTVAKQEQPDLMGPSGFALSLQVTAAPQILARDGSSMSSITVLARNADGTPLNGRRLRLLATAGTLMQTEVSTTADGKASTTFIAPGYNEAVDAVTIFVDPIEVGDRVNTHSTSVVLEVLGPDIPAPAFEFTPATPAQYQTVTFNASTTRFGGVPCGSGCQYDWTFGDGSTRTGLMTTFAFQSQGAHMITVLVTAPSGTYGSASRVVTVGPAVAPTASFTFSPADPLIFDQVFFDGGASRGANGSTIVSWEWNFGNNTFGTGVRPPPVVYTADRSYNVTLRVTDDRGESATVTRTVTVAMP